MIRKTYKIELLAPAKDKKTGISAINAGADAVYIGFLKFGARKQAGNSIEDIKELIEYANIFRAKVYVTFNTIYNDKELNDVIKTIYELYDIGISGIIIQDMGILTRKLPPVKIFASTQCHNNTLEKITFLEKTGFDRVILPREFSLSEIENITNNTNIEVEVFIHGALCVSYSGQCYLSSYIGGRSANRGECAQPCRKKYSLYSNDGKLIAKDKYLLSLKDLNLSDKIENLINAGVTSFKIEGRLKDENYVKNVVAFYRQKIDKILEKLQLQKSSIGKTYPSFNPDLSKSFNRGFTEFFINGKRENFCTKYYSKSIGEYLGYVKAIKNNYFILSDNKLNNGDGICFLTKEKELIGTNIQKVIGEKIFPKDIKKLFNGAKIYRNNNISFEKELTKEISRKIPITAKVFVDNKKISLTLSDEEPNSITEIYYGNFEMAKDQNKALQNISSQFLKTGNTEFEIQNINIKNGEKYFIPKSTLNEIRRNAISKLQQFRKNSYQQEKKIIPIQKIDYPIKELDYKANIYNKDAEKFYIERNAKVKEYAAEQNNCKTINNLMTTKHCIKYTFGLCKKHFNNVTNYQEPLYIMDEVNKKYILEFDCQNCQMRLNVNNHA
jgi:putative protease